MARHDHRDHRGRWAKSPSGAPIPNADGSGADPIAYNGPVHNDDDAGYPEFNRPYPDRHEVGLSYDPSHGGYSRRIQPRHAITIDGETGQRIAHEVDHEMRGVDTLMGGHLREQAHLQAAGGDPLVSSLMSHPEYDIHRRGHEYISREVDGHVHTDSTHAAWPEPLGNTVRPTDIHDVTRRSRKGH
jgi:hypothetical protein